MTTAANISRWKFRLGTTASPPVYQDIEEVFNIGGLGKTKELVDVTSYDSPTGTKEFIGGLADGDEITIECNRIPNAVSPTKQQLMIAAVNGSVNRDFQIAYLGVVPEEKFTFRGTPLSWKMVPSTTDKNTISFTVKISGDITVS